MFGPKPLLFAEFEMFTFSNGSIAKRTRPNESLRRTNSPRRHVRFPISQDRSCPLAPFLKNFRYSITRERFCQAFLGKTKNTRFTGIFCNFQYQALHPESDFSSGGSPPIQIAGTGGAASGAAAMARSFTRLSSAAMRLERSAPHF